MAFRTAAPGRSPMGVGALANSAADVWLRRELYKERGSGLSTTTACRQRNLHSIHVSRTAARDPGLQEDNSS